MILNLTQHEATPEQVSAGVVTSPADEAGIRALLTFKNLPTREEIQYRAISLAAIAANFFKGEDGAALIGGAPYLMAPLERELHHRGIVPLYSFSERVSEERTTPSGEVVKTNVFKHVGFVEAV